SAEGCRVLLLTDTGGRQGSILPLKASGHVYGDEVNTQPATWDNLEVRVDERVHDRADLVRLGFQVGDTVAIDPQAEITESGFIVSRHLDNKAGVACMLTAMKALVDARVPLPVHCQALFTIFEEVGSGASAVLHQDAAEMVSIDNATIAPEQGSVEYGVTIAMMDSSGPFDFHLTRKLLRLAADSDIVVARDVYKDYRCDAASAV